MPNDWGFETEDCADYEDGPCDGQVEERASSSAAILHPRCVRHADIYIRNAGAGVRVEIGGYALEDLLPGANRSQRSRL